MPVPIAHFSRCMNAAKSLQRFYYKKFKGKIQNVRGQRCRWAIGEGIVLALLDLPFSLDTFRVSPRWDVESVIIVDQERRYGETDLNVTSCLTCRSYRALPGTPQGPPPSLDLLDDAKHSNLSLADSAPRSRRTMTTDKLPINPLARRSMTLTLLRKLV